MPAQRVSETLQRLEFNEKLVQSGKKESNEALLKRIKTLHQKLKALEQDTVDVKSLETIRRPLIHNTILHHKDRGVKAYAACCLADILRLTAPDAPYSASELRDIFQFFIQQIQDYFRPPEVRALQVSKNKGNDASQSQSQTQGAASQRITDIAYYTEYYYLLESLATIKSVVLAADTPQGDKLVTGFFQTFVDVVRPDMSKNLIRHLVSILSTLVEETPTIPSDVMDIIIGQFDNKPTPPDTAFQLIIDVCNSTSDKLQRPILAHFSDIQLKHGRNPSQEDLKTLATSHRLLLSIYRLAPGLLLNVVPVLEENLRAADEIPLRQLSTRTLGKMFGERPIVGTGMADLARAYPSAWRAWLGRRLDKATAVRLAWVESSRVVLANHPELRQELEPFLVDRIQDSSEVVRAAICKVVCSLEYETALHQISENTLRAIGLRMSDKKANVRSEAATGMAKLWSGAYSEIEANEPTAVSQFGWIPEAMFQCLQKDVSIEMRVQMTSTIKQYILPLPERTDDEQAWVDRLMLVATHLDDSAFKALEKITGLRGYARGNSPYRAFIEFCEANNGGIIDENEQEVRARLTYIINAMAKQLFPEPDKAKRDMEAFAAANESRLYKLFKACADPHSDLKTLVKAKNELVRRIEQSHSDILDTFTTLINNASFNIINPSAISPLIKILSRPGNGQMKEARIAASSRLLSLMAKECAPMYRSHVAELGVVMSDKKTAKLSEVALQALAALAKVDGKSIPNDERYIEKARKIMKEGTPRQGKFAARFLSYHADAEVVKDAIEATADALEVSDNRIVANLRILSEFALSSPASFETKSSEIHDFVIRKVIHKRVPAIDTDDDVQWIEESELPAADQAKLVALRLVTHRVLGFARASNALDIAKPVFELLDSILANDGATNSEEEAEGEQTRAQLRLRASLCALKLANVKVFDKAMSKICQRIAYVMKDPVYHVRFNLLLKFATILPMQRLLPRWNIIPALIALDPTKENVHMAKSVIASTIKACSSFSSAEKIDRIEVPLARLLWLLASEADSDEWTLPDIKDFARYIELYLDCVANRDNSGLLFQVAGKIKNFCTPPPEDRDAEDEESRMARASLDKRLYKLSELAQIVIRNRSEANGWSIPTYLGPIPFPRDIFHNLPIREEMHDNTRKVYLTDEEVTWATPLGRKAAAVAGPSRRPGEANTSPVKRAPGERKVSKKRARKTREESSDESEEDDEDDEDEDQDELESEDEAMSEVEEGDGVVGRGGKRGAKTKAKKGLKKKTKSKKAKSNGTNKKVREVSSELSEGDDE